MSGRSSYLRSIALHADSNLPLLRQPRTQTRRWGKMPSQDVLAVTTLSVQRPSVNPGTVALLQPLMHNVVELQPALPMQRTTEMEVPLQATSPSSPRPSRGHAPIVSPGTSPANEGSTPMIGSQKSQAEIQLTPARTKQSPTFETGRTSLPHMTSKEPTSVSSGEQSTRVTLRPICGQESDVSTITPRLHGRPAASLQKQERTTIHIGTIDVHVVPPATPLPTARSTTARARSASALSREFTSVIGLRQG